MSGDKVALMSYRTYLAMETMSATGCGLFVALEAVASTAIEHPEWDMAAKRPYLEWKKMMSR